MVERELTYFVSDLHLGAAYIPDPHEHQRLVVEWLRSIAPTAKRLYLLGDVLDYWYEYKTVVPRGYTRFLGALAELADSGVEITWFIGNHDIWIFGYLQEELGIKVHDGAMTAKIDGATFYMAHGDGVGKQRPGFRIIRSVFRNKFCQWLYGGIHPRWTIPFAHRWSSSSRKSRPECSLFEPDTDNYVEFAEEYLSRQGHVDYFIFGHKHLMVDYPVGKDSRLIILGDWITRFSYGVWDGKRFSLRLYEKCAEIKQH